MWGSFAGLLLVYSAVSLPATGYVMQEISYCGYGDKEGNVTFQFAITFNRLIPVIYDPTDNMFLPYQYIPEMLPVLRKFTTEFNTKPEMINYVRSEEKRCKDQRKTFWNGTAQRSVRPSMEVFYPEQVYGENLPLLICHVWGFYPPDIAVSWIKNEGTLVRNETEAVRVGDWTYQLVAKLDLRDSLPEDTYTCVVRHQSLEEPMVKTWKAGLTSIQMAAISVSAVIFALGLVSLITGVICWRGARRSDVGHVLPSVFCRWGHIFIPCLPPPLSPREESVPQASMSSLLSCDSSVLLDEEKDLWEDSDADSIEGQLVRGGSLCSTSESPVPFYQGCALRGAGMNLDEDI